MPHARRREGGASGDAHGRLHGLTPHLARGQVNLTKSEYETIVTRVDAEMARFQTEKLIDFKKYVTGFIKLQLEYSERVQASWRELLPRLEEIDGAAHAHALRPKPTEIS